MTDHATRTTIEAIISPDPPSELAPSRLRPHWLMVALAALAGAALLGLVMGPAALPARGVLSELISLIPGVEVGPGLDGRQVDILVQLRLPRVVLGALVGGTLAMSGAAYQGVFRNPLADPYLLGVAAGAGLGATIAIAYLPDTSGWIIDALPLFAFCGAFVGVGAAWALGHTTGSGRNAATLILAGVAVAAFLTAMQTYIQQREADTLRQVYTWLLGRLATSGWSDVLLVLPYVALSAVAVLLHRRLLDVMSVGDDEADTLGVRTERVRMVVVLAATLGTAAVVAVSGLIGFVGIIVPHAVRLLVGPSYRLVLPLSLLGGATFLVLADVVARTAASPAEVPIGVITAFLGAPFFAVILHSSRRAVR